MRIVTPESMQTRRGPEEWFTGARTNWHTHPEGQILFILTGTCRVAREDEPPVDVEAGDVVIFAPNEKHWHGAGPGSYMVHAAVSPAANSSGGTDWLEPVTDEQYAAGV